MKKATWYSNNRLIFLKEKNENIALSLNNLTFTDSALINTSIYNSYNFSYLYNNFFFTYLFYVYTLSSRKSILEYGFFLCALKLHKYI